MNVREKTKLRPISAIKLSTKRYKCVFCYTHFPFCFSHTVFRVEKIKPNSDLLWLNLNPVGLLLHKATNT